MPNNKLFDRVKMSVSGTPGTGTITLGSAATGYRSFSGAGVANSNVVSYLIEDGSSWEFGTGTYTSSGTTLSRDTVTSSSAGGTTKISVTSGAFVYITALSADLVQLDSAGNATALGTPASATLTNATGLPISTGVSGLGTNVATFLATPSSANLASALTDETGSGANVFATSPTLVTPTLGVASATSINKVAFTAPATSATLALADGSTFTTSGAFAVTMTATATTTITLPTSGTLATTSNKLSAFAATTSSELAGVISDETGSGALVFGTSPTLTTSTHTGLKETKTAPSISSGTLTLDCAAGNVFAVSLNANITTLTFSNVPTTGNAYALTLSLTADGTARTVTWGSAVKWPAGTAPTLTSTNAKVDTFVLTTWDGGTTWYAFIAGQNA